jgi:hypothetical protein
LGSFAKVAASGPSKGSKKENIILVATDEKLYKGGSQKPVAISEPASTHQGNSSARAAHIPNVDSIPTPTVETNLADAIKAMNVDEERKSPMPSLVVNGSGASLLNVRRKTEAGDSFSEDPFHRTDSGSELGTKPPSLDGKSITSGTTFALDEKESLRPDDSASVKAAEDDDTFSGMGSIVAGSRIGSEAAGRAYRAQAQYFEGPDRRMQNGKIKGWLPHRVDHLDNRRLMMENRISSSLDKLIPLTRLTFFIVKLRMKSYWKLWSLQRIGYFCSVWSKICKSLLLIPSK